MPQFRASFRWDGGLAMVPLPAKHDGPVRHRTEHSLQRSLRKGVITKATLQLVVLAFPQGHPNYLRLVSGEVRRSPCTPSPPQAGETRKSTIDAWYCRTGVTTGGPTCLPRPPSNRLTSGLAANLHRHLEK
jgi:hypothetical protein